MNPFPPPQESFFVPIISEGFRNAKLYLENIFFYYCDRSMHSDFFAVNMRHLARWESFFISGCLQELTQQRRR